MKVPYLNYYARFKTIDVIVLAAIYLMVSISPVLGQSLDENDTLQLDQVITDFDTTGIDLLDTTASGLSLDGEASSSDTDSSSGLLDAEEGAPTFWSTYVTSPMRLGIRYELAYKFTKPDRVMNNRLSYRLEYSKSFFKHFSVQVDTKVFTFLKNDHRGRTTTFWINEEPTDAALSFGGRTREAYLQASFAKTSIKAGIQTVVWGESDFAIVTNEISRLDYREPLSLNIDELRIGQPMITVDHFSSFGDWSGFFTPNPKFNEQPRKGTGYYFDPFEGSVEYQSEKRDRNLFEYGLRWKKTFGKSDVSIMAASMIDNRYAMRMFTPGIITRGKERFNMAGITFNRAMDKFVVKGEAAMKFQKSYNDASLQILKRNAIDASLGIDYSINNTLTLSMEAVNYHVVGWNDKIQGVPKNNYMLLLILSKQMMNNDLMLNWVTMYNGPYTNFFNLLTTSYNWSDHVTLYLDLLIPITDNKKSGLYLYRDQKQAAFKIQYQF